MLRGTQEIRALICLWALPGQAFLFLVEGSEAQAGMNFLTSQGHGWQGWEEDSLVPHPGVLVPVPRQDCLAGQALVAWKLPGMFISVQGS